ncbi:transcriptional regulator, TetR family [Pseudonocardia ammonioxydans]|uniref:Transcriptional regulator, TetR family n=2 Tax=Pseudonocardia ammonioxydans TaxID=260086 RepID=A0A1I5HFI2_PSUAM|nr:transcriptional regulator, TetR family [Pseudonocardia ammonioxydans]
MPRMTRAESRQQTRERLLAAAAELFAERGVNGASVEQIAERAGYSRGAFYGNFTDKHELAVDLLKQRTLQELEEVTDRTSGEDPFGALREWHTARAEHLPGWLSLRMELILYALRSPEFRPLLAERERIARDAHTRGVETAFAGRDATPPAAPDFLALIVHALEDGLLVQRMLFPDEISDQVVVDAVELLMRGWLGSAAGGRPDDEDERAEPSSGA